MCTVKYQCARALPAVQPRVKPLVWTYPTPADRLCHAHETAPSFGGAYHISPDEDSSLGYWLLQWTLRVDDFCTRYGGKITRHNAPEVAKAAAQADYEARILSALEPAVQPDAAAHGAEHWDTLAPWSKYSSDVVLVVHHILTEPAVPTATVRFELPERAGSNVLGHCAADTVEEAVMGAIDAAQAKLRALIDTGKEVMPDDQTSNSTHPRSDTGPGDQAVAGAAGPFRADPEDWTEDYAHEAGINFCECLTCGGQFYGQKGRIKCRVCYSDPLVARTEQLAFLQKEYDILHKDYDALDAKYQELWSAEIRRNILAAEKGADRPPKPVAPPSWPEGLIHLTNTRRFHVDCATEGCGRRVSTRFAGSDYCEPCGRRVALAQKGDSHE
jgi:hypothetical protein